MAVRTEEPVRLCRPTLITVHYRRSARAAAVMGCRGTRAPAGSRRSAAGICGVWVPLSLHRPPMSAWSSPNGWCPVRGRDRGAEGRRARLPFGGSLSNSYTWGFGRRAVFIPGISADSVQPSGSNVRCSSAGLSSSPHASRDRPAREPGFRSHGHDSPPSGSPTHPTYSPSSRLWG